MAPQLLPWIRILRISQRIPREPDYVLHQMLLRARLLHVHWPLPHPDCCISITESILNGSLGLLVLTMCSNCSLRIWVIKNIEVESERILNCLRSAPFQCPSERFNALRI